MIEQSILIKAPIQVVYDCITDFESYPKFLTEMSESEVQWCEDKEMEVSFKINLIKSIQYTLHFELDAPHGIYWNLKRGDMMKKNDGSWHLKPQGDTQTKAVYNIDIEFGLWVPKPIVSTLVEKSLPQTLARFKKQSEKLYKRKSS